MYFDIVYETGTSLAVHVLGHSIISTEKQWGSNLECLDEECIEHSGIWPIMYTSFQNKLIIFRSHLSLNHSDLRTND